MLFELHPIVLAAVLGSTVGFLFLVAAYFAKSRAVKGFFVVIASISLLPSALLFVLANPGIFDARFRAYKAFYKDIDVGMTRAEVLALMSQHYPTNGARLPPKVMEDTSERLGFFMNPEGSTEPNCEGIFLTLEHEIVRSKSYSPD
jgi:hypothetical protein